MRSGLKTCNVPWTPHAHWQNMNGTADASRPLPPKGRVVEFTHMVGDGPHLRHGAGRHGDEVVQMMGGLAYMTGRPRFVTRGFADLKANPQYTTHNQRVRARSTLMPVLRERLAMRSAADLTAVFERAGLPSHGFASQKKCLMTNIWAHAY